MSDYKMTNADMIEAFGFIPADVVIAEVKPVCRRCEEALSEKDIAHNHKICTYCASNLDCIPECCESGPEHPCRGCGDELSEDYVTRGNDYCPVCFDNYPL